MTNIPLCVDIVEDNEDELSSITRPIARSHQSASSEESTSASEDETLLMADSGSIICNVQSMQEGINSTLVCKTCVEERIESKLVAILNHADRERKRFKEKVELIPMRTQNQRDEYIKMHQPSTEDMVKQLKKCSSS